VRDQLRLEIEEAAMRQEERGVSARQDPEDALIVLQMVREESKPLGVTLVLLPAPKEGRLLESPMRVRHTSRMGLVS
jgi:hypothetical protein